MTKVMTGYPIGMLLGLVLMLNLAMWAQVIPPALDQITPHDPPCARALSHYPTEVHFNG